MVTEQINEEDFKHWEESAVILLQSLVKLSKKILAVYDGTQIESIIAQVISFLQINLVNLVLEGFRFFKELLQLQQKNKQEIISDLQIKQIFKWTSDFYCKVPKDIKSTKMIVSKFTLETCEFIEIISSTQIYFEQSFQVLKQVNPF